MGYLVRQIQRYLNQDLRKTLPEKFKSGERSAAGAAHEARLNRHFCINGQAFQAHPIRYGARKSLSPRHRGRCVPHTSVGVALPQHLEEGFR
jgi:hypothetical protein